MRVIFLDVDGVLNNDKTTDRVFGFIGIDPKLVDNLKILYDESNKEEETKVVISSSWKMDEVRSKTRDYEKNENCYAILIERLTSAGIDVIGSTPEDISFHRDGEILSWLEENEDKDVTTWVILDDEEFDFFKNEDTKDHIVQTNGVDGLTEEDVNNALKVLRGEEFKCTPIFYY